MTIVAVTVAGVALANATGGLTRTQARAIAGSINLADVPGFSIAPLERATPAGGGCGAGVSHGPALATKVSGTFNRTVAGNAQELNSTVVVWPAASDATALLAYRRSLRGRACLARVLKRGTPAGTTEALSDLAAAPPGGFGLRVRLDVGGSLDYIDLLGFARGPADVSVSFVYEAVPPTRRLERRLVRELQARATAALPNAR